MKRFTKQRLVAVLCATGLLNISSNAMAAAFQLWEQDAATVGNYHAGYAALANDASTAWYNPAGITRIKNQQMIFGGVAITSDFKFSGTNTVNTIPGSGSIPITAQGGVFSFVPDFHYVAPLSDTWGFGLSVDVPFGLKTNYGRSTYLRYSTTETSVIVVDISPSLGYQFSPKFSVGLGLDIQRMFAEIDEVGGAISAFGPTALDTLGTNKANDTAYGFHFGGLYQFTPDTRVGLSYHSQVVHHLTGTSRFEGPLANLYAGGTFTSHAYTNITLPPYTALSFYHKAFEQVAFMGSAIYTQWNTFNNLILHNVSGIQGGTASRNITVSIPERYRNSWNFSLGTDYYATDTITLRGALGYDEIPIQDKYRNPELPDNDRYVIALGGHYQASKAIGFDLGWTHLMFNQARVTPPPQATGTQVTTVSGHAKGGADVYGAEVTWDIA